jgi:hypothetical protein
VPVGGVADRHIGPSARVDDFWRKLHDVVLQLRPDDAPGWMVQPALGSAERAPGCRKVPPGEGVRPLCGEVAGRALRPRSPSADGSTARNQRSALQRSPRLRASAHQRIGRIEDRADRGSGGSADQESARRPVENWGSGRRVGASRAGGSTARGVGIEWLWATHRRVKDGWSAADRSAFERGPGDAVKDGGSTAASRNRAALGARRRGESWQIGSPRAGIERSWVRGESWSVGSPRAGIERSWVRGESWPVGSRRSR